MKFLFLLASLTLAAILRAATATQEIESLLTYVQQLDGAAFIRNGETHDPASAEKHLRMKWEKAKASIKTADQFIGECAAKSSITGKAYEIRLKDGTVARAEDLLRAELNRLRNSAPAQPRSN
jgi:hypothetical protein